MASSPSLLSRLYRDLAELHDTPYPGVAVFIDDANLRQFCLVLTPPAGPWKNLSLHFDVSLPDNWPASPPSVSCSSDAINHPNLFGSYICCDLLKTEDQIYRDNGYNGGYSPALTLRGLFLQFLTFFSSSKVEQDWGGSYEIGDDTIARYFREAELGVDKAVLERSRHTPGSKYYGYATPQETLRAEWDADGRPEVVVSSHPTPIGPLLHTANRYPPDPNRLHCIQERNPRWTETLNRIQQWKCPRCPYGSAAVPHCVKEVSAMVENAESSPLLTPPASCQLALLNDDVLLALAERLPSESVISLSQAYPRFDALVHQAHLRCFFLRTPLVDSVLGIGVALNPSARTLSSDFDWLSARAFTEFGVRQSVEKRAFSFFLPLAFSREHYKRVYPTIWARLGEIDAQVRRAEQRMSRNPRRQPAGPPKRQDSINVVFRMMNHIVVSLMKNCDEALGRQGSATGKSLLHASEKAVVAYCHLFHLLLCLVRSDQTILRDATARLRRFISDKAYRVKTHVPDLGELIILIMLVLCQPPAGGGPPIKWSNLAGPFLEQAIVRNVRWVLKASPHLEVLETGPSDYRLAETFAQATTSLRLIMFQITFLDIFFRAYAANIGRLDDNYGFPDKELPTQMVQEIKQIYKVDTWPGFFQRVRFQQGVAFGRERFSEMLRDAVKASAASRYHTPASKYGVCGGSSMLGEIRHLQSRWRGVVRGWIACRNHETVATR
ncbi:hypothetical protein FB45DRAFT_987770 [Roridomyces roridus]|uniref:UBC core domain-containing protein n=1 Tax=Roridomyces roridus TaxID=1738132 RepID=A0AAD7CB35_9AGAR|nr:hypothetical protein FB45DRAFT_987770 [Roridomyces roridus]